MTREELVLKIHFVIVYTENRVLQQHCIETLQFFRINKL